METFATGWIDGWASPYVSDRSKLLALGIDMDEEEIFAPHIGPALDAFTVGDKDALEEWLRNQPVKEITPEQRKLLDKFDYWIDHLDLSKKRNAPRGGAVSVTSPESTAWR